MARQTAAERKAAEAAEHEAYWAKAKAEYPNRVMKLMAQFSEIHNFSFTVHTDVPLSFKFKVGNDNSDAWYHRFEAVLGAELESQDMYYNLESAEREVERHYAEVAEEQRRYEVLRNAQAKLNTTFNAEERELLGLK